MGAYSDMIGVRTPDMVQDELQWVHRCYQSWRRIALLPAYIPIPAGTLSSIAKTGKVPKKWRPRLNLPADASVIVMYGEIKVGSQSLGNEVCACGQPFISNHPRRKKCFMCSPYRGKRKG